MAYITPKTNWAAGNIPVASDFNRIEGNAKQNHDDIGSVESDLSIEEAARISADSTLQTNINNEAIARAAEDVSIRSDFTTADNGKLNNSSYGTRTRTTGTLAAFDTYTIPAGTYYGVSYAIQINVSGDWYLISSSLSEYTFIISDGINMRFKNTTGTPQPWTLIKIS